MPKRIVIRGVAYLSQASAARHLGVSRAAISKAFKTGNLDGVGLGIAQAPIPIVVRGQTYDNMTQAAKAIGVTPAAVSLAVKRNRTHLLGTGHNAGKRLVRS